MRFAAVVGGIGAIATVALQAALLTGDGFAAMTDVSTLRDALTEGLDWATVVLLVGLALVHLSTDMSKAVVGQGLAFYGGLAVAVSFAFWGHSTATSPRWLSFVSDSVHVATAAIWLGGLVGLGLTLWRRRRGAPAEEVALDSMPVGAVRAEGGATTTALGAPPAGGEPADDEASIGIAASTAAVVSRFSGLAGISLVLLVLAGLLLSWKEVGSVSALWSTAYGRTLLIKLGVVALILVAAAYNRWRLVPQIEAEERAAAADPSPLRGRAWTHLTRSVIGEALGVVVVLAITAALVNITPSKNVLANAASTSPLQSKPVAGAVAQVGLVPSMVGNNSMHITYFDAAGRPVDIAQRVTVELTNPDQGIGPISREGTKAATGHFTIDGLQIPTSGTWTITLITRITDFKQERTEFTYDVSS